MPGCGFPLFIIHTVVRTEYVALSGSSWPFHNVETLHTVGSACSTCWGPCQGDWSLLEVVKSRPMFVALTTVLPPFLSS